MSDKWPDLAGRIEAGKHLLAIRIYYEDTDFSGFVYHANYIKFCERGRSDCLRMLGVHHNVLFSGENGEPTGFVVKHMDCNFHTPAHIDELLEVQTRFVTAKGARVVMEQQVLRDEQLVFSAMVTAALVDAKGRPKRFSSKMLETFAKLDAGNS